MIDQYVECWRETNILLAQIVSQLTMINAKLPGSDPLPPPQITTNGESKWVDPPAYLLEATRVKEMMRTADSVRTLTSIVKANRKALENIKAHNLKTYDHLMEFAGRRENELMASTHGR